MYYLTTIGLIGLTLIFAFLSYLYKENSVIKTATAFLFLVTGVLILSYGIEVPIGELTTLIR